MLQPSTLRTLYTGGSLVKPHATEGLVCVTICRFRSDREKMTQKSRTRADMSLMPGAPQDDYRRRQMPSSERVGGEHNMMPSVPVLHDPDCHVDL